jgi:hypothetical protein
MPIEYYRLIDFDWIKTIQELRKSSLIVGDLTDEGISQTKEVLYAHVKVKGEKVSFGLSQYGKIQIASSNVQLLSSAKSQLNKLISCSRWVPFEEKESEDKEESGIKYQNIMDLPEAKEADWSKIPKNEIRRLNQYFILAKEWKDMSWLMNELRSTLASYAKSSDIVKTKETKSLKEMVKE